jgi:hypothetical protein
MSAITHGSSRDIIYVSSDLQHIAEFTRDYALFGPPLELLPGRPPPPTRYFEASEGVQCISIGRSGNTTDYAIKRPIRADERFQCLTTAFRVIRCFVDCQTAVIEREWRLSNGHTLSTYMLVDSCLGVLAFSETNDFAIGIPHDAEWLRGRIGILADPNYPDCTSIEGE